MAEENPLSFDEFKQLCEDAGISEETPERLEADYRMGVALANVTEEIIRQVEAGEAVAMGEITMANKTDLLRDIALDIRRLAALHDEGQN